MEIIIKLSTGKEISLTPEEAQELLKQEKIYVQPFPSIPVYPDIHPYQPSPWWGIYPPGTTCDTYTTDHFEIVTQ